MHNSNICVYKIAFVRQRQLPQHSTQLQLPCKAHLVLDSGPPLPQTYHVPDQLSSLIDTIRHGSKWLNSTFPLTVEISTKLCTKQALPLYTLTSAQVEGNAPWGGELSTSP